MTQDQVSPGGYNRVFGYYIEVTKSYLSLVPYHYERKQTLANAGALCYPGIKEMEQKILGARDRLIALENELFLKFVQYCSPARIASSKRRAAG